MCTWCTYFFANFYIGLQFENRSVDEWFSFKMHLAAVAENASQVGRWLEPIWERMDNRTEQLPMMTSFMWPIGLYK